MDSETYFLGLLHISAVGLSLVCAVGLDTEPEIFIFALRCVEGFAKYGLCAKTSLPAQLHFNPSLPALYVFFTTNIEPRALPARPEYTDLPNLTAKARSSWTPPVTSSPSSWPSSRWMLACV
jgi:hypothetical protein